MDVDEVKACLRALLSSTAFSCDIYNLLNDFKKMTGGDLPLFGCSDPLEFLRTLDDTVKLVGDPFNPDIALIESKKSSHITVLVDKQKNHTLKIKCPQLMTKPKRLVLPLDKHKPRSKKQFNNCDININIKETQNKTSQSSSEFNLNQEKNSKCTDKGIQNDEIPESNDYFILEDNHQIQEENSNCIINDGIKNKLRTLIKRYPEGLWCCELAELFIKEFNYTLNYLEFGYTSLIQMLSSLPDIFRCVRPGNEDWILFDASSPPSTVEKRMTDIEAMLNLNKEIMANVKILLEDHGDSLEISNLLKLYENVFGSNLDFRSLGYKDVKSLLKTYDGSFLNLTEVNGKTFVAAPQIKSPKEAIPPITMENDLFLEIFPQHVVGPNEKLVELDLACHVAVGQTIEVCAAEVWSPSQFYVQLHKFKPRLNQFMDDLQQFYNVHLSKYKMPEPTIQPDQVCVGLYNVDPEFPDEWHRAKIIKVINEKIVLLNFVDYGTVARVKKTHLRFLHRIFQYFPMQGFLAQLAGVAPPNDEKKWSTSTSRKFLKMLEVPYLKAEVVDIDFKKPQMSLILTDISQKPAVNINKKLIKEKMACKKRSSIGENVYGAEKEEEKANCETIPSNTKTTNEFSDIKDLEHSIFQMKSLGIDEETKVKRSERETKFEEVADVFAEVFDLDKPLGEELVEPKVEVKPAVIPVILPRELPEPKITEESKPVVLLPPTTEQKSAFSQVEETKKRVNLLSMELLTKNPSIRQVGMIDPALALKIAMEMAEAYIIAGTTPPHLSSPTPTPTVLLEEKNPSVPIAPVTLVNSPEKFKANDDEKTEERNDVTRGKTKVKENLEGNEKDEKNIKEVQLGEKSLYLITADHKLYFCVDEVLRKFTSVPSRDVADGVLKIKKTVIDYKVVTKATDNKLFNAIKWKEGSLIKKKRKKIYLIPVSQTMKFLNGLSCTTKSYENELQEILKTELSDH